MKLSKFAAVRRCAGIAALGIAMLCAHILSARTLEAEGLGFNRNGALRAALRDAVEQCVGVSISSKTVVENYVTISDRILTQVAGYVSQYNVLSETPDHGLVRVRISADVSLKKLEDDLAAQKLLYEIKNKPRIMVLLDEWSNDKQMVEKTATFKFQEQLVKRGFIVVESEQNDKIKRAESLGDQASMAFEEGADIIIRGAVKVASSTPKLIYGAQFYSVPVQINARIVRADNAQVIAVRTKSIRKNSQEAESAAQFGLTIGGEAMADELIGDLNNFWNSEAYNENRIVMTLSGFGDRDRAAFETSVGSFSCTRTLMLRFIENKNALYDVEIRGTVHDLHAAIMKLKQAGVVISLLSANRIVVKKGPAGQERTAEAEEPGVDIARFAINDIFPSRIGFYGSNPVATVRIVGGKGELRDLKASVFIPELMDLPSEVKVGSVDGSTERDLPVKLVFNRKKLMDNRENRTVNGQATITFRLGNKVSERKLTAPVRVYGSNAINWSEPEAIGAFVSFRAPIVASLASTAVRALGATDGSGDGLKSGLSIFELMRELGITYVKDPAAVPGAELLDQVNFPQETLEKLSGDCDDLAVLYAALLSSVGVGTAVISYSDHVLVMFDTKVYEKNRSSLSLNPHATVTHNGTLWIPVETTLLAKGFTDAWRSAAKEFEEAIGTGEKVEIVDLEKAWRTYPPAPVPAYDRKFATEGLAAAISAERRKLEDAVQSDLAAEFSKVKSRADAARGAEGAAACNELGVIRVRQEKFGDAVLLFEKAAAQAAKPEYASNRACALLLTGKEDEALAMFDTLYRSDTSGHIGLNRGLGLFVKASDDAGMDLAVAALREAVAMMKDKGKIGSYLGLDLSEDQEAGKGAEIQSAREKVINLRRLKELIRARVLAAPASGKGGLSGTTTETSSGGRISGTTTETSVGSMADRKKAIALPFGGIRGADPAQVSKVKDLLFWFQ